MFAPLCSSMKSTFKKPTGVVSWVKQKIATYQVNKIDTQIKKTAPTLKRNATGISEQEKNAARAQLIDLHAQKVNLLTPHGTSLSKQGQQELTVSKNMLKKYTAPPKTVETKKTVPKSTDASRLPVKALEVKPVEKPLPNLFPEENLFTKVKKETTPTKAKPHIETSLEDKIKSHSMEIDKLTNKKPTDENLLKLHDLKIKKTDLKIQQAKEQQDILSKQGEDIMSQKSRENDAKLIKIMDKSDEYDAQIKQLKKEQDQLINQKKSIESKVTKPQ